jgi:hypothetical protein
VNDQFQGLGSLEAIKKWPRLINGEGRDKGLVFFWQLLLFRLQGHIVFSTLETCTS